MSLENQELLKTILVWLIPCLPAITIHEVAHGWAALSLGDPTARDAKRLSLNPFRHVDLFGTIIVPWVLVLAHAPFLFGWAKPVPVDFSRLKKGRLGVILVAMAGPSSNLLMMLAWLAAAHVMGILDQTPRILYAPAASLAAQIVLFGVIINFALLFFNLIPLPPLDGGRILGALLPEEMSRSFLRLERYGIPLMILLVVTGILNFIMNPLIRFFFTLMGIA